MDKTLLIYLTILCHSIYSQEISVNKIEETRSNFNNVLGNNCKIELQISGEKLKNYTNIRLQNITKATDDQHFNLIKESTWGNKYIKIANSKASVEIELERSSRDAKKITELEGNLVLFRSSEETNSEIHVPFYRSNTNQNLLGIDSPLKIYYITRSSLIKLKSEAKFNQHDVIKNLYGEATKLSQILNMLFDDFEIFGDEKREIVFLRDGLESDYDKLIDVYFLDESNQKIEKNGFYSGGPLMTYTFAVDILPTYTMVLTYETPTSTEIIPFKFTNIALP